MHVRFRKGQMPQGGTYEEFTELLARLYRTFEPLKERGGEDGKDFMAIKAGLELLAVRHGVATPQELLAEQAGLLGYATPFEVIEHLSAIVRDFGLCHPQGGLDDEYRNTVAWTFLKILHRRSVIEAAFETVAHRGEVATGVRRWLKPDSTPMTEIFSIDPNQGAPDEG